MDVSTSQHGTDDTRARGRAARTGGALFLVFIAAELTLVLSPLIVLVPFAVADPSLTEGAPLSPAPLVAILVIPPVFAALVAVAGTALFGAGPRQGRVRRELAWNWNWRDTFRGLSFGVAGLVITIPAAAVWASWVGADKAESAVGEVFKGEQLGIVAGLIAFLGVWLIAPLCEEVMFRGVLWRTFEHWRWHGWVIFAVTTVVFSVAHMELLRTPLLLVLSIPIGLARLFTRNLTASVVAHQVNNFLPALALLFSTTGILAS
ncbi:type II CAAX endopeptidase family protein [Haloechinothrix halophila]|uniref:type II CAAX endopeptidase family protein n=1 Tax=Haloechinothrix halophila TaxID=1069073 RepID=UPI001E57F03C|nr:type II CAAX endopeptidase family protein [Haloechinothrix halophila]